MVLVDIVDDLAGVMQKKKGHPAGCPGYWKTYPQYSIVIVVIVGSRMWYRKFI
jgi:hypothetical protein